MARILLVSKPVAPPWNDSSKNLVRDLALGMERHEPVVMGRRGSDLALPRGRVEPVYPDRPGGFAPALSDNARVLALLLGIRNVPLWHFFFAPNPRSSTLGAAASRLRRRRTVQTVCSAPRPDRSAARLLFADVTVVLSAHTEARLLSEGVAPERIRRIPPSVPPLEPLREGQRREARAAFGVPLDVPLIVYPGDLEFGSGAELTLDALLALGREEVWLAMACRAKTEAAREAERRLRERAAARGLGPRVRWVGETQRIHELIGAADVVTLPSETFYAKMDYPLVLLEAMSMARAVVVASGTPAAELAADGGALAIEPQVDGLAATLLGLLDDGGRRTALGDEARRRVLEHHGPRTMASAYEALYDSLL